MTEDRLVRLSDIKAALKRLEDEHMYGYPEFWDYLAEAEASRHDDNDGAA